MKKITALFSAIALVACVSGIAGADKEKKPVDVWTCPIQGAPAPKTAKAVTYKSKNGTTYNVHFCCGGCPEEFTKLSAKEKEAKIAAAVKKDAANKKKG